MLCCTKKNRKGKVSFMTKDVSYHSIVCEIRFHDLYVKHLCSLRGFCHANHIMSYCGFKLSDGMFSLPTAGLKSETQAKKRKRSLMKQGHWISLLSISMENKRRSKNHHKKIFFQEFHGNTDYIGIYIWTSKLEV